MGGMIAPTNLHARWAAKQEKPMIGDTAEVEKQRGYQEAYHDMIERYEKLALRCIEAERALSKLDGVTSQDDLVARLIQVQNDLGSVEADRTRWKDACFKAEQDAVRWRTSAEKAAKLVQVPDGAGEADVVKWLQGRGYRVSK
jgi:hypothetical protein